MTSILKHIVFTLLLFSSITIAAQKSWELDNNIANGLSSSVFIPDMQMAAFINGTGINFVPLIEGETVSMDITDYGELPTGFSSITSAVKWDNSNIMLFNGITYVMLNINGPSIQVYGDFPNLPTSWGNTVDAAVEWGQSQLLFFNGDDYVIYSKEDNSVSEINSIGDWSGWELSGVDAILNIDDGYLYFFKNNKYQIFNQESQAFEGSATKLSSGFGGPPVAKKSSGPPVANAAPTVKASISNTSSKDTSHWCLTGTPPGESESDLVEDSTNYGGGSTGEEFEDTIPQGSRVIEIRVWGSYVILGMQTVIETEDGDVVELPILGSKKGKTQIFTVPEGDCITGVKGAYLGDYGDFIHNISFTTSSTKSKNFGLRGKKPFKVELASGLSFHGFKVKFNTYISGISLKFVSYEDNIPIDTVDEFVSSDNFSLDNYKGEYDDNHEDIMEVAMDAQFFGAGESQRKPLPAVEWLGQGVDYATLDPLKIAESASQYKKENPFILITSLKTGGMQGNELIPYGTDYLTLSGGKSSEYKEWNESYGDFTSNFGAGVGLSVDSPVGGGSMSASYKQMNNTKFGSTEIYYTQVDERKMFNISLDMTWRDNKTSRKKRQKLDFDFREKIDNLPVPSSFPTVNSSTMKKGKALPSQIKNIQAQYQAIIDQYGTHFIASADFGGKYVASTRITKKSYEATREKSVDFKASVKAKIKAVDIGADVSFDYGTKNVTGTKNETFSTNQYIQGGAGKTFEEWDKTVENTPLPIFVKLSPTFMLLDEKYWPKDSKIAKKRAILKIVTDQYLVDNYIKPTRSKGGFFSEPKKVDYKYKLNIVSIKCLSIDSDEAGSSNEFFGTISVDYSEDNFLANVIWNKSESNSVNLPEGSEAPINEGMEIKLKEGNTTGYFEVTGKLTEADKDMGFMGGADDELGTKSKKINIADITSELKTYKVSGFSNGGDSAEIIFTVQKVMDIRFD